MKVEKILVPTDFSEDASTALDCAIELAREFDAKLHLLHAYQPVTAAAAPYGMSVPVGLSESVRAAAAAVLSEWQSRAEKAGAEVETHLCVDIASSAITQTAGGIDADLIVMGTRGLTGLKHILIGSVAERTVRSAPCPVLTVKAEA